jgi:hypothetical protein
MYIAEEAAASVFSWEKQDSNRRQVKVAGNGRLNVEVRTPEIFKAPLQTYFPSFLYLPRAWSFRVPLTAVRFLMDVHFPSQLFSFTLKMEAPDSSEILSIHHTTCVTSTKPVIVIICLLFMLATYRNYNLWLMTFSTYFVFSFIKQINPFTHSL